MGLLLAFEHLEICKRVTWSDNQTYSGYLYKEVLHMLGFGFRSEFFFFCIINEK